MHGCYYAFMDSASDKGSSRYSRPTKPYASPVAIKRAVKAVAACGIRIGSVEVRPDGTIMIHEASENPRAAENDFDRLERAGLL